MPVALWALAAGAFGIGTTEFVIMGLLPQVGADLGVSLSSAGLLVTGYALGVTAGAPPVAILTTGLPRKTLLELGLGFHSELTGRENIMLQGTLLGFSRGEMRRRTPRIVEWAEIEEFIDAPIRTYSSGMAARLAFSVATDVEPDILLVDEALAVGDEGFQLKCHQRIEDFRKAGKTVLFVSHALSQVRENCRRAVWVHEGRIIRDGDASSVTELYHRWSLGEQVALPQAL